MDFHFNFRDGHNYFGSHKRPLLGVELVGVTDELREHLGSQQDRGVLVGRVLDEMPASRAGIEVGDLIVDVDGEPIENARDLRRALRDRAGELFHIGLIRDGRSTAVQVELPSLEDDDDARGSSHRRYFKRTPSRTADVDRT